MRIVFAWALLSTFLAVSPGHAQDDLPGVNAPEGSAVAKSFDDAHRERLAALFSDLKRERNEKAGWSRG